MQTEKGVTLISVTIYIIVMLIIVTVITVLTSYFYQNVDINSVSEDFNQQYTKFNSYFTEEVNRKGNKILDIIEPEEITDENMQVYIVFSSGNQYTFIPEQGIYMNNVKIAENIIACTFDRNENEQGKTTITVILSGENTQRETTYTLID